MVATTVIEVGVNVPNATVMVIESAEKFGLSQLHQLRGRVGRGGEKSLLHFFNRVKISNEARERLTMVATNDGFKIAEKDLEMRGPEKLKAPDKVEYSISSLPISSRTKIFSTVLNRQLSRLQKLILTSKIQKTN